MRYNVSLTERFTVAKFSTWSSGKISIMLSLHGSQSKFFRITSHSSKNSTEISKGKKKLLTTSTQGKGLRSKFMTKKIHLQISSRYSQITSIPMLKKLMT